MKSPLNFRGIYCKHVTVVATFYAYFTHGRVISESWSRHKVFKMTLKNCIQSDVLWAALRCPGGS